MTRWLKATAIGLSMVMGVGAVALAGSEDTAKPPLQAVHEVGHHHKARFMDAGKLLQQAEKHPEKAVERLTKMLSGVQKREQALTEQIGKAEQRLAAIQDAQRREVAQAALEVRKAELNKVQKMAVMLQKTLDYAKAKAKAAPKS